MIDKLNTNNSRINEIAEELAGFGLGIFTPHTHNKDGSFSPHKSGIISYENNLKVSFIPIESAPKNAVAVGWVWNGENIEVCAGCCADGGHGGIANK